MEECLILLDGTPEGPSEVVPLEGRQSAIGRIKSGLAVKVVPGVQGAVAQILKERAVKAVRPALAHDHHLASHRHAILGAEGIGNHAVLPYPLHPQGLAGGGGRTCSVRIHHESPV